MKKINWLALLGILLLVASFILNIIFYQRLRRGQDEGIAVLAVLDGDTLVLENKTRLRLREVEAPELKYCGGQEARKFLEQLLAGKEIKITAMLPDQRGRGIAYLFDKKGININLEMVRSGWVRYHHDQTPYSETMKMAAKEAQEKKLGIYGLCWQKENKESPKCNIKGNIDERKRKIYYLPNCAQYPFVIIEKDIGEKWFCSEEEAEKEGYIKAKTCR